ncbi:MAG: acetate--CoA ligase family protein [Dehalococcoidales bacterium]|nr:acetate--CoA ligase family protein [Dehalococcoidales bacterium]
MMLLEHMGKAELAARGLPIPRGYLATTPAAASEAAANLGGPVAVKAQVPAGGRGKAGGIVMAEDAAAAEAAAARLLGATLVGHRVQTVLVEERLAITREFFLGLAVDPASAGHVALFSTEGGVDIETVAARTPERVRRLWIDPLSGLPADTSTLFAGLVEAELIGRLAEVLGSLYEVFRGRDALLTEINPLVLLTDGRLVAADCRLEVDEDSLFRQTDFQPFREAQMDEREREAFRIGVSYVRLGGDVGLIASGAGLGMASLDMLKLAGLTPANFLDTGGGITRALMRQAVQLTLGPDDVRGELINLYGGINPMVEAALGIVDALHEMPARKPMVVKLLGNRQEEAWSILEGEGVPVVKCVRTEDAAEKLAALLAAGGAEGEA